MQITIGPVASSSALAWIDQARKVNQLIRGDVALPFDVPWDVLERFERSFDEWYFIALDSDEFEWSGDFQRDDLRIVVQYWFNIVQFLYENTDGVTIPLLPLEAVPFRDALVPTVLGALAAEEETREFATTAEERWPGLHSTQYPYGKAASSPSP